jgi:Secretion system C-terminal sorting domain
MRNFTLLCLLSLSNFVLQAQDKTFEKQGYYIGNSLSSPESITRCMMGEIERIGSDYYLYFAVEDPTQEGMILYATSPDLSNWTIMDTVVKGVNVITDRQFILGGPRVIKTPAGLYRMFYRTCQKYTIPAEPLYHIRSAVSSDGINFTPEGIRIEINAYDATSYFTHVGHSEFYYDAGGNLRALLTAKDTTMGAGPDQIYTAQSFDDGLTWTNFVAKYPDAHDPVVIVDSSGTYHTYFTYLNTAFKTATSSNGVSFPSVANTLYLLDGTDTLTESSSPVKLADLGAVVDASGNIFVFSNYSSAPGPWTEIAYFSEVATGIFEDNVNAEAFSVYPNPAQNIINFDSKYAGLYMKIIDITGRIVLQQKIQTASMSVDALANGVYTCVIVDAAGLTIRSGNLVIRK